MIAASLALAVAFTGTPAPADQPYVLVAWEVGNPESIWETPQTLESWVMLSDPTLDALDAGLPCGATFQIDLYYADNDTAALIAGGLLYGPQNPKEPHAYVVDGDPWKFVTTDPCAVKPEPRVYENAGETFACDGWTYWTETGFYDLSFDPVANVWSEAVEPTVTASSSEVLPASVEERVARGCESASVPVLAETGAGSRGWLFGALGVALLGLGGVLVGLARSLGDRYKRGVR